MLSNFVVGLFEITRSRNIVSKSSGWSEKLAEDEVERWCRAGHRVRVFLSSGSMTEDNALSAPKVMIAPALRTNVSTYRLSRSCATCVPSMHGKCTGLYQNG